MFYSGVLITNEGTIVEQFGVHLNKWLPKLKPLDTHWTSLEADKWWS